METKTCKKCGIEKSINDFRNKFEKRFNKSYLYSYCKECEKAYHKQYQKNNKEKFKRYNKKSNENKKYHKEYNAKYYKKNKEKINKRCVRYKNEKKKNDSLFKIKEQARIEIWVSFKRKGFYKNKHTEEILGCKLDCFYNYLLETFKSNYGYEWDKKAPIHIDHIVPLSTAKTEEEVIRLCHYTNLQLLKAQDNLEKSNKMNWELLK